MPMDSMMDEGMDSLHADSGPPPPRRGPPREKPGETTEKTALVPASFLTHGEGPDPQEGDECTVRVVKNYGDEVEIAYVPDTEEPAEEEAPEPSAEEEFAAMDGKEY